MYTLHVLQWAMKEFDVHIHEIDWRICGEDLFDLTLHKFNSIVLHDANHLSNLLFWIHLELLRKYKFAGTPGKPTLEYGIEKNPISARFIPTETPHNNTKIKSPYLWQVFIYYKKV